MSRTRASLLAMLIAGMTCAVLLALPFTPRTRVHTMTAQRGEVMRTVLLGGTVAYSQRQLCVNMQDGRIGQVYVRPGQLVKKGELLFRMDTSALEAALASLYSARNEQQALLASVGRNAEALSAQQQSLWMEKEASLRLAIESASIRAEMDGVVESVYMEENRLVQALTPLGVVRGEERCIEAVMSAAEGSVLSPGAAGEADGMPVRLHTQSAPDAATGLQTFTFLPLSDNALSNRKIGETVLVEAVAEVMENCVPIPLSAVDRHNRVWYVEDGKAVSETLDSFCGSRDAVAAPLHWEGRKVILHPEEYALTEGCGVKEAKRR